MALEHTRNQIIRLSDFEDCRNQSDGQKGNPGEAYSIGGHSGCTNLEGNLECEYSEHKRMNMQTTKLYVEYIVIGMEALVWIVLLVLLIIGKTAVVFLDYCIKNLLTSLFMIGACYVLGLLVDRIADTLTDGKKKQIKSHYPIEASTSITVWQKVKQDTFAEFTLSRIRILRSTILNFVLTGVIAMLVAAYRYHNGRLGVWAMIFFEIMAMVAWQAHTSLLVNYYQKTQKLERDMACEEGT